MVEEIKHALTRYENALASVWQTDGMMFEVDGNRYYKLEQKQIQFQRVADAAKQELIEVINKHTCVHNTLSSTPTS